MERELAGTNTTPHDHVCEACGVRWCHDPITVIVDMTEGDEATKKAADEAHQKAHQCPWCGFFTWKIADEDGADPAYLNDGRVCLPVSCRPASVDDIKTSTFRMFAELMFGLDHGLF